MTQKKSSQIKPGADAETAAVVEETKDVTPVRYSDEDLREFDTLIYGRRTIARKELENLQGKIVPEGEDQDATNEQIAQLIVRQKNYIEKLDKASERIKNKTYGICATTGKLIDKARLRAVPHATLSIAAKMGLPEDSVAAACIEEDEKPVITVAPEAVTHETDTDVASRKCRVCGCTQDDCTQCIEKTGEPCHWVEDDLCSACVEPEPQAEIENRTDLLYQPAFFSNFFPLLDGIDVSIKFKRQNGKLILTVLPETAKVIKPLQITGTPAELDEDFFSVIQAPIDEAKGLKIEQPVKNPVDHKEAEPDPQKSEAVQAPTDSKKEKVAKPVSKKAPEKKIASKKNLKKLLEKKPVEKKPASKKAVAKKQKETVTKRLPPDMFA